MIKSIGDRYIVFGVVLLGTTLFRVGFGYSERHIKIDNKVLCGCAMNDNGLIL